VAACLWFTRKVFPPTIIEALRARTQLLSRITCYPWEYGYDTCIAVPVLEYTTLRSTASAGIDTRAYQLTQL